MKAFAYFIQGKLTKRIKIGESDDVCKRLYALQVGSPEELVLIGKMSSQVASEKMLHEKFKHLREIGEYFTADYELLQYIIDNAILVEGKPSYKADSSFKIIRKAEEEAARLISDAATHIEKEREKWEAERRVVPFSASLVGLSAPSPVLLNLRNLRAPNEDARKDFEEQQQTKLRQLAVAGGNAVRLKQFGESKNAGELPRFYEEGLNFVNLHSEYPWEDRTPEQIKTMAEENTMFVATYWIVPIAAGQTRIAKVIE